MTKFIYTFLLSIVCFFVQAQDDYVDPIYDVEVTSNVVYGANVSVLTQGLRDLVMDVYTPIGDSGANRPVVLIAPTGSFLPVVFNGSTAGSKTDSTVVEIARRLAARGYVAAVYDYRKGWLPTSTEPDIRKGTLLQAAYRGIQDTNTAIRFFRKTEAEDGNPWGINPDDVGVWGIGTGGYLSLGAGSLDDISEVTLDKFLDANDNPLIVESVIGNIEGTIAASQSVPNHVGYSSKFNYSFNAGGALGDASWMDGRDDEPTYTGVHCPQDLFAPFYSGLVIVPTTNEIVVDVAGTRLAIETANALGSNDGINNIQSQFDPILDLIEEQKTTTVVAQIAQQQPVTVDLGTDNFYAFNIPLLFNGAPAPQGSPWDWWSLDDLTNLVAAINSTIPDPMDHFDADQIHVNGLRSNPDMSAEKARRYIDTMFMMAIPRMYVSMGLGSAILTGTDNIEAVSVGLSVAPNPATDRITFKSDLNKNIQRIQIYDIGGKLIENLSKINDNNFTWKRGNQPNGVYIARLLFDEGVVSKKIIIE